jgi:predicted secreted Zn-dependent protease
MIAASALVSASPIEHGPFDLRRIYTFAGLPNVELRYYDVRGSNIDELTSSFRDGERRISGSDPLHAGRTDVTVRWRIFRLGTGRACKVANVEISYKAIVYLPRLVHPETLDATTRGRVERFIVALTSHEAGHAHNRFDHLSEARAAVRRTACSDADAAMSAAQARDIAADGRYEAETQNGKLQGAVY